MAAALLIRQSRRSWALAARVALSPAPSARACSGEASEPAVNAFLRERGYADDVAAGILKELTSNWGVKPGQELPMVKALAGAWEVGDDAGLNALAQAVERELARSQGKALVRFLIRPPGSGNRLIECDGFEGMSIKDVIDHGEGDGARALGGLLECACSGVMACSTCQVYVDEPWLAAVGEPNDDEQDMLDLAHEPRPNSRLGCQVVLRPELNGLVLAVPGSAHNLFDHIPFEG